MGHTLVLYRSSRRSDVALGRWRDGTAVVAPLDEAVLDRFNFYARMGSRSLGIDPKLIRIDLD